jgi:hypothetical protein
VAVTAAGCSRAEAKANATTSKLLGSWYDNKTGGQYRFLTPSVLVIPHAQSEGGNAVTYQIIDGGTLDIATGSEHHVSTISKLTTQTLVLRDPLSNAGQAFYRDPTRTAFARSLETSAVAALRAFPSTLASSGIVWVAKRPIGKGAGWTNWPPTTIGVYATAWDWGDIRRDTTPIAVAGGGSLQGFSFGYTRKVPTADALKRYAKDTSVEATAGLGRIDVGYSASKAKYPAGTMVYLPGGLIYSLGDGFAIPVTLDAKNESFVPLTHP